jgi:hypothetical protein
MAKQAGSKPPKKKAGQYRQRIKSVLVSWFEGRDYHAKNKNVFALMSNFTEGEQKGEDILLSEL